MKRINFFTSIFLCIALNINAQVGIGSENPDPSAILELKSKTKGFLLPRINDVNEINNTPVEGLLIYDMQKHCVSVYKNNKWTCLEYSDSTKPVRASIYSRSRFQNLLKEKDTRSFSKWR